MSANGEISQGRFEGGSGVLSDSLAVHEKEDRIHLAVRIERVCDDIHVGSPADEKAGGRIRQDHARWKDFRGKIRAKLEIENQIAVCAAGRMDLGRDYVGA